MLLRIKTTNLTMIVKAGDFVRCLYDRPNTTATIVTRDYREDMTTKDIECQEEPTITTVDLYEIDDDEDDDAATDL